MSTAAPVNARLAQLTELGTSVWLDQIRRSLTRGGELARLVREDSLRGVTSNPAIFEKAILGSEDYDEHLAELAAAGASTHDVFRELSVLDVQEAADVLRPVFDETGGLDGYVSLEVHPALAHDGERTLAEARELWAAVDRPNCMIKIPGTDEALGAIEDALAEGINVNITLLFSVAQYAKVVEAHLRALERRRDEGKPLDVASVASFFVSRVDTEVDKRLAALGREELRGKAGLANARAAYRHFKQAYGDERFAALREAGARVQRPLWASTGVKDPAYPDTLYVDGLAGPDTVNTMPMPTLLAAADHADLSAGATADLDPEPDLRALADAGVDLDDVTGQLLREGIAAFVTPMDKLLAGIESKREAIVTGRPPTIESSIPDELEPAIAGRIREAVQQDVVRRIWAKDDTVWGEAGAPEVANRLGWLTIAERMEEHVADLEALRDEVREAGLGQVVLLGMGGSSLAPEVFKQANGNTSLHVLDTTDAAAVAAAPTEGALYVVSSKSGGTIETLSALHRFWELTGGDGSRFVAVTDPGSSLAELARERGFRRLFENDPDIGGRYSALSFFGLVPAALAGIDVRPLLEGAQVAAATCAPESEHNSGLWLGVTLGELALQGRDKLTFVVDPPLESFGLWVEQLIAESTGKHGKGVLPVADEPLGAPEAYGPDRVFAHLRNGEEHDDAMEALRKAGHPVLTLRVEGPEDLGRIMVVAEFGTAVAGWALGINPFDQPNVQAAKDKTKEVLEGGGAGVGASSPEAVRELLRGSPPSYLAIQAYVAPSGDFDDAAQALRATIRDRTCMTTTFGYGPRYLHSTGQLHKGGPRTGRFLQLLHVVPDDLEVPGEGYTFEQLKRAQADGDLLALREAGFPVERVEVTGPADLEGLL